MTSAPFDMTKACILMNQLNVLMKDQAWYVCVGCNELMMEPPDYYPTSKWGYERPFCSDCVRYCETCDEEYVDTMAYQHEDCTTTNEDKKEHSDEDDMKDEVA